MGLIALLLLAAEIWLLVQVGAATSAVFVVGGVLLAFFVGLSVMRHGARRVAELGLDQSRVSTVMTPLGLFVARHEQRPDREALLDAMGLVLAGFLLILPGFVSDAVGLLLLVPPVRRAFIRRALSLRGQPKSKPTRPHEPRRGQADVEVLPPGSLPRSPLQKRPVVIDVE